MKKTLASLIIVAAALVAGCNIVGPLFVAFAPPPRVPKEYTIDPNRSVVVFVDDRSSRLPRRTLRLTIAEQTQRLLMSEGVSRKVVDARAALAATSGETASSPMDIATIGRAVQADLVVYVSVDEFTLSNDGQSMTPMTQLAVKVIDAREDRRLWPDERAGRTLVVKPSSTTKTPPRSSAELAKAEESLAQYAGVAVAQLFYSAKAQESAIQGR